MLKTKHAQSTAAASLLDHWPNVCFRVYEDIRRPVFDRTPSADTPAVWYSKRVLNTRLEFRPRLYLVKYQWLASVLIFPCVKKNTKGPKVPPCRVPQALTTGRGNFGTYFHSLPPFPLNGTFSTTYASYADVTDGTQRGPRKIFEKSS